MANTLAHARQRFFDAQGVPLAFGKVWTYDAGTTVPRPTFADAGEVTANPNPVILDVNGEATIYWRGTYKVNLTTSADAQVPGWPEDDVTDITTLVNASVDAISTDIASTASGKGAALVGLSASAAYMAATVGYRLNLDRVFVTDHPFSADNTNTVDAAAAIQSAIDSVPPYTTAYGLFTREVFIPAGKYKLNASVLHRNGVVINADRGAEFYVTGNFPAFLQSPNTSVLGLRAYSSLGLKGLNIVGTNGTTNNAGAGLLNSNLANQHGIQLSNSDTYNSASYLFVENCFIYNCGGHGMYVHKPAVSNGQFGWTQFGHISDVTLQASGGWAFYADGVTATGADFASMETYRIHCQGNYGGGVYVNGGNDNKLRFTVNNTGTASTPSGTFTNPTPGPSIQLENQLNSQLWCHIENNNSGEGLVIGRVGMCYTTAVEGLFYHVDHPIRLESVNGASFNHLQFGDVPVGNYCIETTAASRGVYVGREWYKDTSGSFFLSDGNFDTPYAATGYIGINSVGLGPSNILYSGLASNSGEAIGYIAGSGGAVVQPTSKATSVTLNAPTGQITTANDSLAANTTVVFAVTNTRVAVGDTVAINISSGPASPQAYIVRVARVLAGAFVVAIKNDTAGALAEAIVMNFTVTKGAIT